MPVADARVEDDDVSAPAVAWGSEDDSAAPAIALAPDLGGQLAVDTEVAAIVAGSRAVLEAAGAAVEAAYPTLTEADDTFRTLRAWHFQAMFGPLLAEHPDEFKASLADNIRAGEHLTGASNVERRAT